MGLAAAGGRPALLSLVSPLFKHFLSLPDFSFRELLYKPLLYSDEMPPNICRPIYAAPYIRGEAPNLSTSLYYYYYITLFFLFGRNLFFLLDAQRCWALAILSHVISLCRDVSPYLRYKLKLATHLTSSYTAPKRQSPCSFYTHTINFANELFWAQANGYKTTELFAVRKLGNHVLLQQDDEFRHFNLSLTTY